MLREEPPQVLAQICGQGVSRRPRHDISRQRLAARLLAGHHGRLRHLRVAQEGRLDLAGLDAEAADLHLPVAPAEELDGAVRPPAGEVAGAVEPLALLGREEVGHEALGGQIRPAAIAAGEAVPPA